MHDLLIVGVPLIAILAGIFFNNGRLDKLEARSDARFDGLESCLDRMQSDLGQFYITLGKHEVRVEVLEKREAK